MSSQGPRLLLMLLLAALARPAAAQIDPERRQLLQLGFNHSLDGRGPLAAYAYYYLNAPDFLARNKTLRLVLAPGYVDSELGFSKALGPKTDLGIGFAGGAFADSYSEIRQGRFIRGESFRGDGLKLALGVYHDFPQIGPMPLAGVVRVDGHYAKFTKDQKTTEAAFELPRPQGEIDARAGFRLGGQEPLLRPNLAGEVSVWYESRFRLSPTSYGFSDDRRTEGNSQLFWGRALLIFNETTSANRFIAIASAGSSLRADRSSAYKLGGDLPMAAEFPLALPGYYNQEISARRYGLLGGTYIIPMSRDRKTWTCTVTASSVLVEYAPGSDQRGKSHTGVGGGLAYLSPSKGWQIMGAYGYGINAQRGHGNGGHTVGMLMQFDFQRVQVPFFHPNNPKDGLHHLLRVRS